MRRGNANVRLALTGILCAAAVAGCAETPSGSALLPSDPSFLEAPLSAYIGDEIYIDVPGGPYQRVYITVPDAETPSTVAEVHEDPQSVYVACSREGTAWVKVLTGNGAWKIYPLTCLLRYEAELASYVGDRLYVTVPGGTPQTVYVAAPHSELPSGVATAVKSGTGIEIRCANEGTAWVVVRTGNNFWKIYDLTCTLVFEAMIEASVDNPFPFWVPGGTPQNAYISQPYSEVISDVAVAEILADGVSVRCDREGTAWIKVHTGNDYWKIYLLTCSYAFEPPINLLQGNEAIIAFAGGIPQQVNVTQTYSRVASTIATTRIVSAAIRASRTARQTDTRQPLAQLVSGGVGVKCVATGSAWVRVLTGSGTWKIIPVTCRHDQGGGG